jgi:hypothetical protein
MKIEINSYKKKNLLKSAYASDSFFVLSFLANLLLK